ncbi:hypothetical protein MGSAQ_000615 [marine sediment metagenome]|uniref:Uncharacterized protein n=1 Tax=marine sediment metagenome TaxID=412755 RepID=A0A1B6NWX0_9ZZZZ
MSSRPSVTTPMPPRITCSCKAWASAPAAMPCAGRRSTRAARWTWDPGPRCSRRRATPARR